MGSYCFGIDVGGTTVKCGLFQTDGTLVDKWEIPTRTENKGENILPDVANAINEKLIKESADMGGRVPKLASSVSVSVRMICLMSGGQ